MGEIKMKIFVKILLILFLFTSDLSQRSCQTEKNHSKNVLQKKKVFSRIKPKSIQIYLSV